MKIITIILLLISTNTYAQEQKQVDMSNMRQFNFGKCNGIDGNYIPNLSNSFYSAQTCQDAYLQYDVCDIEASAFEKAFEAGASIENGKIVKKDIFLKEYKGQCDSWLKVRTRGCKKFIKREATKCGGKGKYRTGTNFFNQTTDGYTGLIKTKDIVAYSESEYQIEQDKIAAEQERQRLAELEQQRLAAKQERQRLAKLKQERQEAKKRQQQIEAISSSESKSSGWDVFNTLLAVGSAYVDHKVAKSQQSDNSYTPPAKIYTSTSNNSYTPPAKTYTSTSRKKLWSSATKCISTRYQTSGKTTFGHKKWYYKNNCSRKVTVHWCETSNSGWHAKCNKNNPSAVNSTSIDDMNSGQESFTFIGVGFKSTGFAYWACYSDYHFDRKTGSCWKWNK